MRARPRGMAGHGGVSRSALTRPAISSYTTSTFLHGSACRSAEIAASIKITIGRVIILATTQEALQLTTVVPGFTVDDLTLESEPFDSEWKTRVFEVADPSGFLLTISSESVK